LIDQNKVYIGGSDHHFRALDLATGKELWNFDGLDGPVVSTPVLYKNTSFSAHGTGTCMHSMPPMANAMEMEQWIYGA
jgi:outer membrane protein assembly factor BamB